MARILVFVFTTLVVAAGAKYYKRVDEWTDTKCGCPIKISFDLYVNADCSNLPRLDFECLAELQPHTLKLSGNGLEEVPSNLNMTGFKNLKHLDLSENKMKRLSSWNFGSMVGLVRVNLSGNQLTELPRSIAKMKEIDVSNNQLTDIYSIIGLVNIVAIVKGNPIKCNCTSPKVKRIYKTKKNVTLECIYGDSEVPRPLPTQCRSDIIENVTPWNIWIFLLSIIAIVVCIIKHCKCQVCCDKNNSKMMIKGQSNDNVSDVVQFVKEGNRCQS